MNNFFYQVLFGLLVCGVFKGMVGAQAVPLVTQLQVEVVHQNGLLEEQRNYDQIEQLIRTICSVYVRAMLAAIYGDVPLANALQLIQAVQYRAHDADDDVFLEEVQAADEGQNGFVIPSIDQAFRKKLCKYIEGRIEPLLIEVSQPVLMDDNVCRHLSPDRYASNIQKLVEAQLPLCDVSRIIR